MAVGSSLIVIALLVLPSAVYDIPPRPPATPTARVAGLADLAPGGGLEVALLVMLAAVVIGVTLLVLRARRR